MSLLSIKAATAAVGASGVGIGGYGIYRLYSSNETIRDRIVSSLVDKRKRFLGRGDPEWSRLSSKYTSLQNKPKRIDGITDLEFSEIPAWCEKRSLERYSDSNKDIYDRVLKFCFFNTHTLFSNVDSGKLKSSLGGDSEEWESAWDEYYKETDKDRKGLKITADGDDDIKINGADKKQGGPVLYKWCTFTKDKKMYEAENLFPSFKRWCIK